MLAKLGKHLWRNPRRKSLPCLANIRFASPRAEGADEFPIVYLDRQVLPRLGIFIDDFRRSCSSAGLYSLQDIIFPPPARVDIDFNFTHKEGQDGSEDKIEHSHGNQRKECFIRSSADNVTHFR